MSITLAGLENRPTECLERGDVAASSPFLPQCTFQWNGQPTADWYVETADLSDVFGNTWNAATRKLSFKEPAWKLHLRVLHKPSIEVPVDQGWTSPDIEIPRDKDLSAYEEFNPRFNGVGLAIMSILTAGPYRTPFGFVISPELKAVKKLPSPVSGAAIGEHFEIHFFPLRYGEYGTCCLAIESVWPSLIVYTGKRQPIEKLLEYRVEDEQGRHVPMTEIVPLPGFGLSGHGVRFLKTMPDSNSLRFIYTLQEARHFEFFVKPPELPKGANKQ